MGSWLAEHLEVVIMGAGGLFSIAALLWRGASDTQRVLGSLDMIGHRLGEVERSVQIASTSREKLHGRIDALTQDTDNKVNAVRERVVVLETRLDP